MGALCVFQKCIHNTKTTQYNAIRNIRFQVFKLGGSLRRCIHRCKCVCVSDWPSVCECQGGLGMGVYAFDGAGGVMISSAP